MRNYLLAEARASFSKIVDRALAGEPQRVTRRGQDAVVIVSERAWRDREPSRHSSPMLDERPIETFADALVALAMAWNDAQDQEAEAGSVFVLTRPLGQDFLEDD